MVGDSMCQYAVVFSSQTGNTEKIATAIYNAIPNSSKDIIPVNDSLDDTFAQNYFIGFNANNGSCTDDISSFLSKIHNKKVALFGTYSGIDLADNYNDIIQHILEKLPSDNIFLGSFLCQAKLTPAERTQYENFFKTRSDKSEYFTMVNALNNLMLHPDINDEYKAQNFAENVVKKIATL